MGLFFEDVLSEADKADPDRKLTGEEHAALMTAWRRLIGDWNLITQGIHPGGTSPSTSFTKGALAVAFVRARLFNKPIPRTATLAYTGHRLSCNAAKFPIGDIFGNALKDERVLEAIVWANGGVPSFDKLLSVGRVIYNHRHALDFPSDLARDLIQEFCHGNNSHILDPCHGWGGRMLGFLLADKAEIYHGVDVAEQTQDGVRQMFEDLKPLAGSDKDAFLELCPFEDATIPESLFDFALTSPPYYDVEKYDGKQTSTTRYDTFEKWCDGFYRPLIAKTFGALKPGCVFALNVSSHKYPLTMKALGIAKKVGFVYEETRRTNRMIAATEDEEDGSVILILRKPV
jgi:hypothetical protein